MDTYGLMEILRDFYDSQTTPNKRLPRITE